MAVVSFSVVSSRMMPLERTCEVESARGADGTAARVEGMRNPSRLQYRADEAPSFAKSFTFDDKFGRDYVSLYHLPLTRTPVVRDSGPIKCGRPAASAAMPASSHS